MYIVHCKLYINGGESHGRGTRKIGFKRINGTIYKK